MKEEVIIVGLGNRFRRDDGVGPLVAARFAGHAAPTVQAELEPADPTVLMDQWQGRPLVIIIDAAQSGERPGTILRFEPLEHPIPEDVFPSFSTHTLPVGRTIALAQALGRLPARIIVYGIEGLDFSSGEGLSPDVEEAVPRVIREIEADLEALEDLLQGRLPCMNAR